MAWICFIDSLVGRRNFSWQPRHHDRFDSVQDTCLQCVDLWLKDSASLITTSAPVALLTTCRLIYDEAKPNIEKMKQVISAKPLKIFATVHFLSEVRASTGFLTKWILAWAHVLGSQNHRDPIYTFIQTMNNVGIYPAPHDAENICLFQFVNTAAMRLQHSQPIFEIMIPMTEAVRNDLQRELGHFVANHVRKATRMMLRCNAQFGFRAEEEVEEWKGIAGEWY